MAAPGHLYHYLMDAATAMLFNRLTREELEAMDDDDLEHIEKFQGHFTRIWAREVDESGRFNFRVQLTEAEIRDAARDWATRLRDATGKIGSSHCIINGFLGATEYFSCRECETFDSFRPSVAAVTVAHIMEEHPPPPLVKSAKKC
jgi:hypothetical protein